MGRGRRRFAYFKVFSFYHTKKSWNYLLLYLWHARKCFLKCYAEFFYFSFKSLKFWICKICYFFCRCQKCRLSRNILDVKWKYHINKIYWNNFKLIHWLNNINLWNVFELLYHSNYNNLILNSGNIIIQI